MTSLLEVLSTKLDLGSVLLLVKVFANFHDLIQIVLFSIDLDGFLLLAGLNVQVCCFSEVSRVPLELSLLDQDLWIQIRLVTCTVFAMFTNEIFSFSELLKGSVDVYGLVNHFILNVVLCRLFELSLIG